MGWETPETQWWDGTHATAFQGNDPALYSITHCQPSPVCQMVQDGMAVAGAEWGEGGAETDEIPISMCMSMSFGGYGSGSRHQWVTHATA